MRKPLRCHPDQQLITWLETRMPKIRNDILKRAEEAVRQAEAKARRYYDLRLPEATIDFSLRGRCAGQARVDGKGETQLRLNYQLLAENLEVFVKQTIPHEVAHLVVNWHRRKKRRRPRPHGPEWQRVMTDCFGLAPDRCHAYCAAPLPLS